LIGFTDYLAIDDYAVVVPMALDGSGEKDECSDDDFHFEEDRYVYRRGTGISKCGLHCAEYILILTTFHPTWATYQVPMYPDNVNYIKLDCDQ
jgi:hypothetical protein